MAASLTDFITRPASPAVEAEGGFAWLVDPDASRVLWQSPRASEEGSSEIDAALLGAVRAAGTIRAGTSRLLRLSLPLSAANGPVTCTCARVPTSAGGEAVLVTAVGLRAAKTRVPAAAAPAQPVAEPIAEPAPTPAAPDEAVQAPPAVADGPVAAETPAPVGATAEPGVALAEPPAWLSRPEGERRPLRFVWQTDANGMFVHVSRELAEAVGVDHSLLVGKTFADLGAAHGLRSEQDVAALLSADAGGSAPQGLQARRTIQIVWPVANAACAIPVEMAGVPVLTAARAFDGLRGYGICRIDQSVPFTAPDPAPAEAAPPEQDVAIAGADAPAVEPVATADATDGEAAVLAQGDADTLTLAEAETDVEPPAAVQNEIADVITSDLQQTAAPEPTAPQDTASPVASDGDADAAPNDGHGPSGSDALAEPAAADGGEAPVPELAAAAEGERPPADEPVAVAEPSAPPPPADRLRLLPGSREVQARDNGESEGDTSASRGEAPAESETSKPESTPPSAGNVVALHPNFVSTDPREVTAALSTSERNAFREIARALGARLESDEPAAATDAEDGETAPMPALAAPDLGSIAARLIHQIPMGTLLLRGGQPLMANRTLLDLLGYADLRQFTADDGMGRLFRGREPSPADGSQGMLIGTRGGDTIPVDALMQSVMLDDGPATLISFRKAQDGSDTPRAKALELDLLAARAQLREVKSVLDTATDGIISIDDKGRIIGMNRSAEALFDYDQNEMTGERFTTLFASESHATAMDYLEGLRGNGVASVLNDGREVVGRERKGGRIPLFMTLGRVGDSASGKFCAVVRDITSWKKAEAELTEAKRAAERSSAQKSDVLAKISHEIRTPLSAIIGFAEVMMQERFGPIGNERYREYVQDIHTSGGHVVSLVNDLLDLAKIEAGRMELSFTSVDLNEIVSSCVAIMQPQANSARVLVRSQLAQRLPPVVADARSVRQIVLNILSNAAKFTEPGGQVIISTGLTERGAAVVRVRDTGVGMSEADLEAAMEPFRQVSNGRTKGGTGLGLPLTKALVEANRAEFSIKSQPARGTLVEVTFPPTRVLAE